MSKKRNKKNINKTLKTLKRKKYNQGGLKPILPPLSSLGDSPLVDKNKQVLENQTISPQINAEESLLKKQAKQLQYPTSKPTTDNGAQISLSNLQAKPTNASAVSLRMQKITQNQERALNQKSSSRDNVGAAYVANLRRASEQQAAQAVEQNPVYKSLQDGLRNLAQQITSKPEFVDAQRRVQESKGTDQEAINLLEELQQPLRKSGQEASKLGEKLYKQQLSKQQGAIEPQQFSGQRGTIEPQQFSEQRGTIEPQQLSEQQGAIEPQQLDVSDDFTSPEITQPDASSLAQQKAISSGSVTRTGPTTTTETREAIGEVDASDPLYNTPFPKPQTAGMPTDVEMRLIARWNRVNGYGEGYDANQPFIAGTAPTDIKVSGPQANIRQIESVNIDPQGGITDRTAVQQLDDATDATSNTVTAETITAEEGSASQAAESGVPEGFSRTPTENNFYPQDMPSEGNIFVYNKETGVRREVENPDTKRRESYTAKKAVTPATTVAAKFDDDVTKATAGGTDGQAVASKAPKTPPMKKKQEELLYNATPI